MNRNSSHDRTVRLLVVLLLATLALVPGLPAMAEPLPPPDVRFSGVITVAPASAGDPWQIAGHTVTADAATRVRLTAGAAAAGMWADVVASQQPDDSLLARQITVRPPEMRLKGPVSVKPESGIGPWTIAGQTIQVTAETKVSERGGPVDQGSWVEVYAVEAPAGTLTALRIRGIESQQAIEVYGAIQAFSGGWMLSAVPLVVTEATLIQGEPEVGLLAQAAAVLDGGVLTASTLRVLWTEPAGNRQSLQFRGNIEALHENGLSGNWQIGGRTVAVTPATRVVQTKGLAELGAQVEVMGWQEADQVVAIQITVLSGPSGAGEQFRLRGAIEGMPPAGLWGQWTIAGQQVQVSRQTRIEGAQYARLGAPVEAGGVQRQDGARIATWLRIQEMGGPGPQPTEPPGKP
jgi:hypothetical protein